MLPRKTILFLYSLFFFLACGETSYEGEIKGRLSLKKEDYETLLKNNKKEIKRKIENARNALSLTAATDLDLSLAAYSSLQIELLPLTSKQLESLGNFLTLKFLEEPLLRPAYRKTFSGGESFYLSKKLQIKKQTFFVLYFLKEQSAKTFISYPVLFSAGDPEVGFSPQLDSMPGKLLKGLASILESKKKKKIDETLLILKRKTPKKLSSEEEAELNNFFDHLKSTFFKKVFFENHSTEHSFLPEKTTGQNLETLCRSWD